MIAKRHRFSLNEAVVNPARRPLAERVIEWADGTASGSRSSRGRSCWAATRNADDLGAVQPAAVIALGGDPARPGRPSGCAARLPAWAVLGPTRPRGRIGPPRMPGPGGTAGARRRRLPKRTSCSIAIAAGASRPRDELSRAARIAPSRARRTGIARDRDFDPPARARSGGIHARANLL